MIKPTIQPPTDLVGYDPARDAGAFTWDAEEARRITEFFPKFCKHIKGKAAGDPLHLNPWEHDFVTTLFAWKREDGTRRYREAFVGIPRKNSKTTCCAALALFMLLCDSEEGAEIYLCAKDRDQSSLLFDIAAKIVAGNAKLSQFCTVKDSYKRIIFPSRNSFIRAIPADAAGSHGFNASAVFFDEMHTQPNRDLYDVMKTSTGARRQPLFVSISTAGHDQESICYELWTLARRVRDGEITDPHFLPVLYEATKDDDWKDPAVWRRVNPNIGRSVSEDYLQESFDRAKTTPSFENAFKNLHLNLWTESEARWISSEAWNGCEGPVPDLTGKDCYAGLDLASTDDITALVYVFPVGGKFYVRPHFFVPEDTVNRTQKRYQAQYTMWKCDGQLTTTPGSATDYEFVRQKILADSKRYRLRKLAFDAWQALDTYTQLEQAGLSCVKVAQTFAGLWPGVKATEEAILNVNLVHDGNEVLRWMFASAVVDTDPNGNRKPNKKKSHGEHGTRGKIDGVVALAMAMGLATSSKDVNPYNSRGVLTL